MNNVSAVVSEAFPTSPRWRSIDSRICGVAAVNIVWILVIHSKVLYTNVRATTGLLNASIHECMSTAQCTRIACCTSGNSLQLVTSPKPALWKTNKQACEDGIII